MRPMPGRSIPTTQRRPTAPETVDGHGGRACPLRVNHAHMAGAEKTNARSGMSMEAGKSRKLVACVYGATVVIGFAFDRMAAITESTVGEAGIAIAGVVAVALLAAERIVHLRTPAAALRALRMRSAANAWRDGRGHHALALALVLPVAARLTGTPLALRSDWPKLAPGLFAQAGLAEELLFRGYLFGTLRETRGFWRAALLALPPFFLVHLLLFATMSFPVAAAATVLSLVVSFPLARL